MAQHKNSRYRITEHGEVFTKDREVKAMCDLAKKETEKIQSLILEPACGDGNFLAEILTRKLKTVDKKYKANQILWLKSSFEALSSLYGIDILFDNCTACRKRLFDIWYSSYNSSWQEQIPESTAHLANIILNKNIICGNTLTQMCVDASGCETQQPIIFSKWLFKSDKLNFETQEFLLTSLLNDRTECQNMHFSLIISNPPYHQNDGGNGASAKPIYHHFVQQAKILDPKYLCMIIPARWYAGGKGLDKFRADMINDRRISELHDFVKASDCFTGVEIKGGVCYFLWQSDYNGMCKVVSHSGDAVISKMNRYLCFDNNNTFIRYNPAVSILKKIKKQNEITFDTIVSPRKPFSLPSDFRDYTHEATQNNTIFIYAQKDTGYVSAQHIKRNAEWIDKWKVFVPEAIGAGNMATDIVKPIIGSPNTVCSETYVVIGPVDSKQTATNITQYISTKFFHFCLGLKKISQHTTAKTYSFVPIQDFSEYWTDELLFKKYKLSKKEIKFIESSIWQNKK